MTTFQDIGTGSSSEHQHDAHDHEVPCTADIGFTEEEVEQFTWGMRGIYEQMPDSGSGFECYGPLEKRYGLPEVVQTLKYICAEWSKAYPSGPRLGIGNISYRGGGPMPPHVSHQKGIDVDLAPIAKTSEEIPLTWDNPKYSQQRTQELVDLIRRNPVLSVRTILFNDPGIRGVEPWAGHDNHLHVSFLSPGVGKTTFSSDQEGSLRLVSPIMRGERVRKLQQDLIKVGIAVTADGDFGPKTDAAVRKFQSDYGLDVDGIAGPMTLAKLAQVLRETTPRGGGAPGLKLQDVIDQNKAIPFDDLNSGILVDDLTLCTEIQTILRANGLLQVVDGLYGPKTREALRRFKASRFLGGGDVLGVSTAKALLEAKPGLGQLPEWEGGDRQATIQAIIKEARRQGIIAKAQIAYVLATVQHETANTFQPVREAYYMGEPRAENYRKTLRYSPYYGRGYVQLTWDYNYREYSDLLNLDLVNQPDLVMRPDLSLFILVDGMKRGVFTGVKLDDYISVSNIDFFNARRVINWIDKADQIAAYARTWQTHLA